jgi:predicted TIM-barrel fold metal-dependent hydrolase
MIDVHMHIHWFGHGPTKAVKHMDKLGVERSWLLGWESIGTGREEVHNIMTNRRTYVAWKKFPDRFIPFCSMDPLSKDPLTQMRKWHELGFRGLGEQKLRLRVDNPDSVALYRLAGEFKWPVLFHIDYWYPGVRFWYNHDLHAFEAVLRDCSEVTFVGHGPGFWRHISGDADAAPPGYPKGPVTPGGLLVRLLDEYPNLYCDLSAHSGLNAISRDPEFGKRFLLKYSSRIMYGTDIFTSELIQYLRSIELPKKVFDAITRKNALRLVPV